MTDKTTVELGNDVWNALLAMAFEHHVPRHVAFAAIQSLQKALMNAQQLPQSVNEGDAA